MLIQTEVGFFQTPIKNLAMLSLVFSLLMVLINSSLFISILFEKQRGREQRKDKGEKEIHIFYKTIFCFYLKTVVSEREKEISLRSDSTSHLGPCKASCFSFPTACENHAVLVIHQSDAAWPLTWESPIFLTPPLVPTQLPVAQISATSPWG